MRASESGGVRLNKTFYEMDDAELRQALISWGRNFENASGWAPAYFAFRQVAAIVDIGNRRGLNMVNNYETTAV